MATFTHPVGPSTRVTTNGKRVQAYSNEMVCTTLFMEICAVFERGSDAKVLASRNPLGPFKYVTNLNHLTPVRDHIKAQSSGIVMVKEFDNTTKYLWTGDMWFSSKSGFKGDDFQYFQPLKVRSQATSIFNHNNTTF